MQTQRILDQQQAEIDQLTTDIEEPEKGLKATLAAFAERATNAREEA